MSMRKQPKALRGWLSSLFEERSDVAKQHATIEAENQARIDQKSNEIRFKRLDIDQQNSRALEKLKEDMHHSFSMNANRIQTEHAVQMGRFNETNTQLSKEFSTSQKEAYELGLQVEFSEAFRKISNHARQGRWYSRYLFPFVRRIYSFLHLPDKEKSFTLHLIDHSGWNEQLLFRLYKIQHTGRIVGGTISSDGRYLAVYSKRAIDVYDVDAGEHVTSYSCRRLQHLRFIGNSSTMIGGHFLQYKLYRAEHHSHVSARYSSPSSTYVLQHSILTDHVLVQSDGSNIFFDDLTSDLPPAKFSIKKNTKQRLRPIHLIGSPCEGSVLILGKTSDGKLSMWAVHWNRLDNWDVHWEQLEFINHRTYPESHGNSFHITILPTEEHTTDCLIYLISKTNSYVIEVSEGYADFIEIPRVSVETMNQYFGGLRRCHSVVSFGDLFKGWHGLVLHDDQNNVSELFPVFKQHIDQEPDDIYGPLFQTAYDGSIMNLFSPKPIHHFRNDTARATFRDLESTLDEHRGMLKIAGYSPATKSVHVDIYLDEDID